MIRKNEFRDRRTPYGRSASTQTFFLKFFFGLGIFQGIEIFRPHSGLKKMIDLREEKDPKKRAETPNDAYGEKRAKLFDFGPILGRKGPEFWLFCTLELKKTGHSYDFPHYFSG